MPKFSFEYNAKNEELEEHVDEHRIELFEHGEKKGHAEFKYFQEPFHFCFITIVWVDRDERNRGLGKEIIKEINSFLKENDRAGFLEDVIPNHDPAKGIYEKMEWKPIPGREEVYTYNLPKEVNSRDVEEALKKIYPR